MGQKTHPIGFRLGVIKTWNSKWFAGKNFANFVIEDIKVKRYINARLDNAGLAKVEILRAPKKVTIDIHTSRPGIVIGRKGAEVDKLREELQLLTKKDISLNIIEVKRPELNARLVADSIARQLEGRVSYRRAMKKAIQATMKMGAEGIKVICAGRLAGTEIARSEKYMDGRVPLHTLRADIDYFNATAHTTYGCIGVKVWIMRGMIMGAGEMEVRDDSEKQMGRPEISMPSRKDRKRRDDRPRRRKPRGRVRRSRTGPPHGERKDDRMPSGGSGRPDRNRPPRPAGKPYGKDMRRGKESVGGGGKPGENKNTPRPTAGPRGESRPKGDARPKRKPMPKYDGKQERGAKPTDGTKPKYDGKQEQGAKPKGGAKPKADVKPKGQAKPKKDARPQKETRPGKDSKPKKDEKPKKDSKPAKTARDKKESSASDKKES